MKIESSITMDEKEQGAGLPVEHGARSMAYAILARSFSYPDREFEQFFKLAVENRDEILTKEAAGFGALIDLACSTQLEKLQSVYTKLFDPLAGPFPYETDQSKTSEFTKAHQMADIAGFYRAFGVEPRNDRCDHISAEFEFMHYLVMKEGHAKKMGQSDNADVCSDASKKFFLEHLSDWAPDFCDRMLEENRKNLLAFYAELLRLIKTFIETEKEALT